MTDAGELSLTQVINGLRIGREAYKEWIMRGFITASIQTQKGARTFNSYTADDVLAVALFKHLIENAKLPREVAARMVRSIKSSGISLRTDGCIVITQKDHPSNKTAFEIKMCEPKEAKSRQAKPSPEGDFLRITIPRNFDTVYIINWGKILNRVRAEFKF
jgi:hypothetical protein